MAVVLPHTFVPDTDASAVQVNENFDAIVAALESVGAATAAADVYQQGVLASTDWALTASAGTINGATGVLSYPAVGGAAWLPGPSGALVRTFTPVATFGGLKPPVLPGPGGFVRVGVELTASGAEALLSVVSGVEKGSEAEAIAAAPAVSAGKVRLHDVVVKNVAGVYTAVAGRDRRPWARGANAVRTYLGSAVAIGTAWAAISTTNLQIRLECSGRPLLVTLKCPLQTNAASQSVLSSFQLDGLTQEEQGRFEQESAGSFSGNADFAYVLEPTAGSHLFNPVVEASSTGALVQMLFGPVQFAVRELFSIANNGTA